MLEKDDEVFLAEAGKSRYVIGDEKARERAEAELNDKWIERAVKGDIEWPEDRRPDVAMVEEAGKAVLGVTGEDLRFHGHRLGVVKAVALELCCRLSGATQRAVSQRFGYRHESAGGRARRVAQTALAADPKLARQAVGVEKWLKDHANAIN